MIMLEELDNLKKKGATMKEKIKRFWTLIYLWVLYLLVWPGSPEIGDPEKADCIFGQAFGRNSMPDEVYAGKLFEQYDRSDLAAIKELIQRKFDPGLPNFELAQEIRDLGQYNLPCILQWEICVALFLLDKEWYVQQKIIGLWPASKGYFHTRAVGEMSITAMCKHGWSNPIEIAHKRQIVRAVLILRKLQGKLPIVLQQKTTSFDSKSVQAWTKNPFLWILREALGRWVHHILYRWVW